MFCLTNSGPFTGAEHVVPESLGNQTICLPRGVICDRCNNGPLSTCDQALVQCPPIRLLKTSRQICNKEGRLPASLLGSTRFHALGDRAVYVTVPDRESLRERRGKFDVSPTVRWSLNQRQRVSRALLKIGLEMLAINKSTAFVMDARFDGIRTAVLHGRYPGFVAFDAVDGEGAVDVTLQCWPPENRCLERVSLLVSISLFGVRLSTAWPGTGAVLEPPAWPPRSESLQIAHFPSEPPAKDSATITVHATVSYEEKLDEWDAHARFGAAMAEIEHKHGEATTVRPPPSR
jgi:hypothetical protein